jgi:hypothetical protein
METSDEDNNDVQMVITQVAALTTQNQQAAHMAAKTSASVNQQTM